MASGDVLPRFFSVYVSQYSSESFLIPNSYYEHLPRPLPKIAILMGDGGKIWKVAMTSRQNQVYFEQGWSSFVTDNDLKDGEFLTFVFDGYQRFQVSTYGHGGCKEIRAVVEVEEISDETDESDDSIIQVEEISDETSENSSDIQDITEISEVLNTTATRNMKGVDTIQNPEALDDPNNVSFETRLKNRNYELNPRATEEHVPLSSAHNRTSSATSTEGFTLGVPTTCSYKETDCKIQTEIDLEFTEEIDPKLSKALFVPIEEEDCPICLEEYDMENPKLVAKCDHHFHLACILEWLERSETCPVCNKAMVFDSPLDY